MNDGSLSSEEQPTIHRPLTATPPTAAGFTPGTVIASRYRIVALVGRGGMGEVYRADDLRLGHPVALKFVSVRSDDRTAIERLYHEVRIGRQVSHPNVCRLHDIVEADGLRFIAMEYVDGEDLASLLRRVGRLPPAKALDVAREIAAGLAAAHDRGIIHRDLKPGNVMIDGQGRAHITDFGLASIGASDEGLVAGTAAYMAPEQVDGRGLTLRSDVYTLGLVLYEMFTGERLYDTGSYADRRKERYRAARRPSSLVRDIDPAVDGVIAACLSEDPALRPASARAVLTILPGGDPIDAAVAAGETPSPEMVAAAAATGELRLGMAVAVVAAIVVALAGIAWRTNSYLFAIARKAPEVLADRAGQIVARAGERSEARDEVYHFERDDALLRSRWALQPRASVAAIRPGILRFVYRRSPSRLMPHEAIMAANDLFIFQSGRVTLGDPALDVDGSAAVILDHHGGLVQYWARPSAGAGPLDWQPLIEATGVDLSSVSVSTPVARPPVASDARYGWTAAYPGQRERVRIEAASLTGRPAWLRVYGPWTVVNPTSLSVGHTGAIIYMVQLLLMIGATIAAVAMAVRSLRLGRSDRRGARRLALYVGGCLFVSWTIAAHHATNAYNEALMFSMGVGQAAASALVVWVFYIALEPGVRRTWPRSLIGWTRLLAGRFGDPMVGREILLGIAGGLVGYWIYWLTAAAFERLGHPSGFFLQPSTLDPLPQFIGDRLVAHIASIEIPIGTIFFLLVARRALGQIAGTVALLLLLALYTIVTPAIPLFMLLVLLAMLRAGVLTAVTIGCVSELLTAAPLTLDTSAWYWPRASAILLIVAVATAWSARVAIGPRRLFESVGQ